MVENLKAYVSDISTEIISIEVLDASVEKLLKQKGFKYNTEFKNWEILISDDSKPKLMEFLRDNEICFADGLAGWPPGAIFTYLREQGKVAGTFCSISWKNKDEYILREK